MPRYIAAAAMLGVLLLNTPVTARQARVTAKEDLPFIDRYVLDAERAALLSKAAVERRADRGDIGEVLMFLAERDRARETISLARNAARIQPAKILDIVKALSRVGIEVAFRERPDGVKDEFRAAVAEIRGRIGALPREEAARAARALLDLDVSMNRNERTSAGIGGPLRAFITEYSGTTEAAIAELDLLATGTQASNRAVTLEKYVAEHPGTVAGAKALYQLAENDLPLPGQPRGGDPTDRFLKRMKAAAELESGKFPPCEWVDRAGLLVSGFYFQPGIPPENVSRIVAAYKEYLLKHFAVDETAGMESPDGYVGYIVTSQFHELATQNKLAGGMDRLFDELEREARYPDAVRYLRAMYESSGRSGTDETTRRAAIARSNRILEDLTTHGDVRSRRRALSTLAAQLFQQRDYSAAITAYRRYVTTFPESDSAWLAAIRIGQAQAELGDFAGAREAFRAAAETYSARPVVRLVALTFASQANAALGDFDGEVTTLKQALEAWDPAFGTSLEVGFPRPLPAPPAILTPSLRRDALAARLSALPAGLARPGGKDLEAARWRLDHADWDGALSILERLSKDPASPARNDAQILARRGRLERALTFADVTSTSRDEGAADRELQALTALTLAAQDFNATAAHIARAALAWKQGKQDDARRSMREGLEAWRRNQPIVPAPSKDSLADDVLAIRDAVFRPLGSDFYRSNWNAFDFPSAMPPYLLAHSMETVKFPDGRTEKVAVNRAPAEFSNLLFLSEDEETFLSVLMARLGGTATRMPQQIMETPNQPVGPSVEILTLFKEFFPARQGHWAGWEIRTYPQISSIEFLDESRTKAAAAVVVGYSGADALLEKRNGKWIVTGLANFWIT